MGWIQVQGTRFFVYFWLFDSSLESFPEGNKDTPLGVTEKNYRLKSYTRYTVVKLIGKFFLSARDCVKDLSRPSLLRFLLLPPPSVESIDRVIGLSLVLVVQGPSLSFYEASIISCL